MLGDPMAGMTTCEPCALRDTGESARAEQIEAVRTQRLLLAYLGEDDDAQRRIIMEMNGCRDCTGRLAARYLGMVAQSLRVIHGGAEGAMKAVADGLADDLGS